MSPFLLEKVTYPGAHKKKKTIQALKPQREAFLIFLNSDHSMSILREQKLKKAREVAAKQRKLREREEKDASQGKETKGEEKKTRREKA